MPTKPRSEEVWRKRRQKNRARKYVSRRWAQEFGSEVDRPTLSVLVGYSLQYGVRVVEEWIGIAADREIPPHRAGPYISGIRRLEFPEDAP